MWRARRARRRARCRARARVPSGAPVRRLSSQADGERPSRGLRLVDADDDAARERRGRRAARDQDRAPGVVDDARRHAADSFPVSRPCPWLPTAIVSASSRLASTSSSAAAGPVRSVVVTSICPRTSREASSSAGHACLRSSRSGSTVSAGMTDATDSTRPAWITPTSSNRAASSEPSTPHTTEARIDAESTVGTRMD